MNEKIVIVLHVFRKFMCIYTILKKFVDKENADMALHIVHSL